MQQALTRLQELEISLCRTFSRLQRRSPVRGVFVAASRLGDGALWYGLMAALLIIHGWGAAGAVGHMAATALAGTLLYLGTKRTTRRLRPCEAEPGLPAAARPLDRYSFPSGHTLHAVCFTIVAGTYYPVLLPGLIVAAALIATSRVALSLHYPTDVLVGALMGGLLAHASLALADALVVAA